MSFKDLENFSQLQRTSFLVLIHWVVLGQVSHLRTNFLYVNNLLMNMKLLSTIHMDLKVTTVSPNDKL